MNAEMTAIKLKSDWRIVKVDQTKCLNDTVPPHGIKTAVMYYLADFSSHTYCCEMTPSLALFPMLAQVEMVVPPETEEEREAQSELENQFLIDEQAVSYYHVSYVETMPNKPIHFDMPENDGDEVDPDVYENKCIDYAREELHANQHWPW